MKRYKPLKEQTVHSCRIITYDELKQLGDPVLRSEINLYPTEEEKELGLYKKPQRIWKDLIITIENPKGTIRSGISGNGMQWSQTMAHDYGYFEGTQGKDKDHIDVFIGPNVELNRVFIVNQVNPETKKFDEHKCMIGFKSLLQARDGYLKNYEKGWQGLGSVVGCSISQLKDFLFNGDVRKPYSEG